MRHIIYNIKSFCLIAAFTAAAAFGTSLPAKNAGAGDAPEKVYYIIYHDDNQNIIRRDKGIAGYEFDAEKPAFYIELMAGNTGWCTRPATTFGSVPEGGTVYRTGDKLTDALTADMDLYPVIEYGAFVRFDSDGGTPIPTQFVHNGQHATSPAVPTKIGNTFKGWTYGGSLVSDISTWDIPSGKSEVILNASWNPSSANYKINVWLEKAEHPNRKDLSDALSHQFDDYEYGTTITKTGTTGGNVSFDDTDRNNAAIKGVTIFYDTEHSVEFLIYFCDKNYGSYALQMSEASVSEINSNGGIANDGSTIVNVFYRRIVFSATVGVIVCEGKVKEPNPSMFPSSAPWNNNYQHCTFTCRSGETLMTALNRSSESLNKKTVDYLSHGSRYGDDGGHRVYMLIKATYNYQVGGQAMDDNSVLNSSPEAAYLYSLSDINKEYGPIADNSPLYCVYFNFNLGKHDDIRDVYVQTIESAMNGNETDINNPDLSHYKLDGGYIGNENNSVSAYQVIEMDGVDYWFSQSGYRVNENLFYHANEVDPKIISPNTSTFGYKYNDDGCRLESFYRRRAFQLSFSTGSSYVTVDDNDRFNKVFYEEPLSNISSYIRWHGEAFVPDETSYTDSEHKIHFFKGWYDNAACLGSPVDFASFTMPARNLILFAKWEVKSITVTFNANGGSIGGGASIGEVIESGKVPSDPGVATPPADSGMQFYCWTLDGIPYRFTDPIYDDAELVAVYYNTVSDAFTITYSSGAGTGDDKQDSNSYLYGANAGVKDFFTDWTLPNRKVFKDWNDGSHEYLPDGEIIVKSDITLDAAYKGTGADIVITRSGLLDGESATYSVYKGTGEGKTLMMSVSLSGTSSDGSATVSRTIFDLDPGDYTVVETSWNWAYGQNTPEVLPSDRKKSSGTASGAGTTENDSTLTFNFSGAKSSVTTKHAENVIPNEFTSSGTL